MRGVKTPVDEDISRITLEEVETALFQMDLVPLGFDEPQSLK